MKKLPECENPVVAYNAELFADFAERSVTIIVNMQEEADVCLVTFAKVSKRDGGFATDMIVSYGSQVMAKGMVGGENPQPVYFSLHLNKGENDITIDYDRAFDKKITLAGVEIRR